MFSKLVNNIKDMSMVKKISIIIILISIIIAIITFVSFKKHNQKAEIGVIEPKVEQKEISIPNVNDSNTKIAISSQDEVENVTVTVEKQLEDYDLYYLVKSNASIELEENNEAEQDTSMILQDESESDEDDNSYKKYEEPILIEENSKIFFTYEKGGNYSDNDYVLSINNIVKKLQESEEVSEEVLKKEKVSEEKVVTGASPYYIRVNYGANVVTIYGKDESGNYTKPIKAMICSCGRATPTGGVYKTSRGYDWGSLVGGVYGQYSTRIVGSILFHSVPYVSRSKDSLEYWEFDKLGTKASAGCVRLQVSDAKWIFNNCGAGVMVEFYSSSDPGPLGKPSAPKISGNERCRNWDPTDYVAGNPWLEKEDKKQETSVVTENKPIQNEQTSNNNSNNIVNDTNNVLNDTIQENNSVSQNNMTTNTLLDDTSTQITVSNETTVEETTKSDESAETTVVEQTMDE